MVFVDGHVIKVAVVLKLLTDDLMDVGAAQDSQKIRKLRFTLEHQVKIFDKRCFFKHYLFRGIIISNSLLPCIS